MKALSLALVMLLALGVVVALLRLPRSPEVTLLVATPGMTTADIVGRSTASFDVPSDADRRGRAQPEGPTRVRIHHPEHGFEVPAGLFTIVDIYEGVAWMVTATPQLDYLGVNETVALVQHIHEAMSAAGWDPAEVPNYGVLHQELPRVTGRVRLGIWKLGSWTSTIEVSAALEAGSEEARIAGMEGGGFLTTLTVYDEALERRLRGGEQAPVSFRQPAQASNATSEPRLSR